MFSFVNDTVLDPFLGSGTTSLAAKNLERNSIGYEINPDYIPVIKEKLGLKEKGFFDKLSFELAQNREDNINWKEETKKLPYIFKDPVKFDKKVDPRKLQFGSKINNHSSSRVECYCVREIISPERLIVGDGLQIRLLGIKENPARSAEAIEFLRNSTHGQRVFLKFDTTKHDQDHNLLCYLYLQNKMFLNAHLIKRGLADVDTTVEYKLKHKFLAATRGH
jgi:site-specific DNA-methyltransferase (adenine-specific)